MMTGALIAGLVVLQLAGVLLVPLGLPGVWLQIVAAVGLAGLGTIAWQWVAGFVVLAFVGEVGEMASGRWGTRRFGGGAASGWGALLGGIIGAIVGGIPVPIIGSVIASFVGTFVGAVAGEMYGLRRAMPTLRVGFGAVIGRVVGVAVKLWCAGVIFATSLGAVLL